MIKHYFKIALRNITRNKVNSFINITGLGIGITAFVFLALFVFDELSYDKHFKNAKQIHRVTFSAKDNLPWLKDVPSVLPGVAAKTPEIEKYTRLFQAEGLVKTDEVAFNESRIYFADTSFFSVFDFPFVAGTPEQFSMEPNSLIITQSAAVKYFGNKNPIGKRLQILGNDGLENLNAQVSAVIKDIPPNTHFHFDFLIPYRPQMASRSNVGVYSYVLLSDKTTASVVEKKINRLKQDYFKDWRFDSTTTLALQPLASIHLQSNFFDELEANGDMQVIYIFAITAFLILGIACINYLNISLAQNVKRSKEIGLRKVLGASKVQVILQFITESFIVVLISLFIAAFLIQTGMPLFNQYAEKSLTLEHNWYLFVLLTAVISLALLATLYPALVLSNFNPVLALKSLLPAGALKNTSLKKGLLVFQFSIAVILLISTAVIYQQLSFIRNKNLGFEKEQVVVLPLRSSQSQVLYPILKQELLKIPHIIGIAASHSVPGGEVDGSIYKISSDAKKKNGEDGSLAVNTLFVDNDYLGLMDIRLLAGKDFGAFNESSTANSTFIVNEAMVTDLNWQSPEQAIGKTIEYFVPETRTFQTAQVTGVIADFHYQSLRQKIEPLVIRQSLPGIVSEHNYTAAITSLSVKIQGRAIQKTLDEMKNVWKTANSSYPFEYNFLDEKLKSLYSSDEKLGSIFGLFSLVVLFITCIGLFGISILTIGQRTKEIGIRKVLGSSVSGIVSLLSKDFLKLVILAGFIAFPVAWFLMNKWLQDFTYRINTQWWVFILAGLIVVTIAFVTLSFQSIKAAKTNPVKNLRTE